MVIYSNFIRNTVCNGRLVKKDTGGQAILKMPCLRDLFAPNGLPSGSFDDFEHFWMRKKEKKEKREKEEKKEKEKEEEGQEAPYNWLTPDHPPLAAFTGIYFSFKFLYF